jgi:hypothetical protein
MLATCAPARIGLGNPRSMRWRHETAFFGSRVTRLLPMAGFRNVGFLDFQSLMQIGPQSHTQVL